MVEVLASGDLRTATAPCASRSDAHIVAATLSAGETVTYEELPPRRHQYLVAADRQDPRQRHRRRTPRDGVAITGEDKIAVEALEDCELVMVDAELGWPDARCPTVARVGSPRRSWARRQPAHHFEARLG